MGPFRRRVRLRDTWFVYREDDHDDSEKTFLGETGRFNGDDIIDIVVKQPATAQFVASNIYRFFVSDEPDGEAIEFLAQAYFDSNYEIREVVRALLHSDFFKEARFQRVKTPAEHMIGVLKLTGQHTDPYEYGLANLADDCQSMGQELLNPPTVEGWHTGHEWIDSAFLIARVNFASERLADTSTPGISASLDRMAGDDASLGLDELIDRCLYEMGSIYLDDRSRDVLKADLELPGTVECSGGAGNESFVDTTTQVMQMIAASREYQMA